MDNFGFRRHPRTKDLRSGGAEWISVWNNCSTGIQHGAHRNQVRTFAELKKDCIAQYEHPGLHPSEAAMALDLIKLIRVGLILVEEVG